MSTEIIERVREIIKEAGSKANIESLKNDLPLTDQGVDSLDMASILLQLEENFNIKIPDEDVDDLQAIDDIVKYIHGRTAGK